MKRSNEATLLHRRNTLAALLYTSYPGVDLLEGLDHYWDSAAGVARHDWASGDGLMAFLLEEVSEVVDYEGAPDDAWQEALAAINRARDDLRHVVFAASGKLRTWPRTPAAKRQKTTPVRKYELIDENRADGLKRLKALKNFGDVKAGDLGGLVAREGNLSQEGCCWVYDDVQVCGDARVSGNAHVGGNAHVYGDAQVFGNARVFGNAGVYGKAQVRGNALVFGDAQVFGNAQVYGDAGVYGKAQVRGNAHVYGKAQVGGKAQVYGDARVGGNAGVYGKAQVAGGSHA